MCQRRHVSSPMLDRSCANRAAGLADRPEMPADGLKYASFLCIARGVGMHSARSAAALLEVTAAEAAWLRVLVLPLQMEPPLEPGTRAGGGASGDVDDGGGGDGGGDGGGGGEPEEERAALSLECPLALWPRFEAAFGAGWRQRSSNACDHSRAHRHPCTQTPLHTDTLAHSLERTGRSLLCVHIAHGTWHMAHGHGCWQRWAPSCVR